MITIQKERFQFTGSSGFCVGWLGWRSSIRGAAIDAIRMHASAFYERTLAATQSLERGANKEKGLRWARVWRGRWFYQEDGVCVLKRGINETDFPHGRSGRRRRRRCRRVCAWTQTGGRWGWGREYGDMELCRLRYA